MKTETMADRLGTTAHLSPLLMKARRLGLVTPEDLERLAVRRGCHYYESRLSSLVFRDEPEPVVSKDDFGNAELAVALMSPTHPSALQRVRLGAAILSAPGVEPEELVRLAKAEGCASLVKHIANCGHHVEPLNPFWESILGQLSDCLVDESEMPHPTRFFEMTGITRGKVGIQKRWIRPFDPSALKR